MARSRSVRKHHVNCTLQALELTKAGTAVNVEIYADGEKIGEVVIGRGSLTWYGRNRKNGKRLSWSRFADLMDRS